MRQIKFRAWDGEKEKFHFFTALSGLYGVLNPIVQQYTGLHDKNGKEIYEGDILKCLPSETVGVVRWCNELALFDLVVHMEGEEGTMTIYSHQEGLNNTRREVIGNIYENPELLTQKV